jgi:hypothetical protein
VADRTIYDVAGGNPASAGNGASRALALFPINVDWIVLTQLTEDIDG